MPSNDRGLQSATDATGRANGSHAHGHEPTLYAQRDRQARHVERYYKDLHIIKETHYHIIYLIISYTYTYT